MTRDDVLAYLQEQVVKPFAWGSTDCVQFAAGIVERVTGNNYAASYTYDSELSAARLIRDAGGLEALVSKHLGPMNRDRRECRDGDIVLSAFDRGPTLGIAVPRLFFLRTEQGVVPVDMELSIGFWRVGAI